MVRDCWVMRSWIGQEAGDKCVFDIWTNIVPPVRWKRKEKKWWKHTKMDTELVAGILWQEKREYLRLMRSGNRIWVYSLHTLFWSERRSVGIENNIFVIDRDYNNFFLEILVFKEIKGSEFQNFPFVCIAFTLGYRVGKQVVTFSFPTSTIFKFLYTKCFFLGIGVHKEVCEREDYYWNALQLQCLVMKDLLCSHVSENGTNTFLAQPNCLCFDILFVYLFMRGKHFKEAEGMQKTTTFLLLFWSADDWYTV